MQLAPLASAPPILTCSSPICLSSSPRPSLAAQANYLRAANYALFALFGLAAINEAAIFVIGLRGAETVSASQVAVFFCR
jgi:hypothetical protein